MDLNQQLYEQDARGWKRGIYEDIKYTFRAPIVNWIFRTTMANYPNFLRYAWGQIKPLFLTRDFARFSVTYRDTVLSLFEDGINLPVYSRSVIQISPAEYAELRGQLASFDIVAPRLAVLFEVLDRTLQGESREEIEPKGRVATEPFPDWLDQERGTAPTMIPIDEIPDDLSNIIFEIKQFHELEQGLPSIYRCMAQWPPYLDQLWEDLASGFKSDPVESIFRGVRRTIEKFVDSVPYWPRLTPDDLKKVKIEHKEIKEMQQLFRTFNRGPIESVVPLLCVYAYSVDASGPRDLL